MTATIRNISFRNLDTTEVHQRFLEGDRDLTRFLGVRAQTVDELLQRAPIDEARNVPREDLVGAHAELVADIYERMMKK